jgi:hypothetical protein
VAHAWEIGVLKGLEDAEIDLTQADLMVGNSAGAALASQLRSGQTVDSLYNQLMAGPPSGSRPNPSCSPAGVDQAYVLAIQQLVGAAPE